MYRTKKVQFLLTPLNNRESVMKKTLLALSVAALAAGSAQAYNFHIDQTGTDVDFYGSLRVKWESTSNKTNYVNGDVTKEHINHAVDNNGSRFGFKLKQS